MEYVFVAVWSIGALALGSLFAFHPEIPTDKFIKQMTRSRSANRLSEIPARSTLLIKNRIGGVFFMIAGVVVPILAFTRGISFGS
ncbi:hypothetical protein [Microbacterium sp. Root166]|uniref:hypothetical protein n=1 Tax=Microbacterium sp. Root166 TaxID=1736478 RepID=UPI0012FC64F1|nr:hypothetical protein [Microbacterium sp. Root166]